MLFLSRSPRSLRPGGLVLSALKGASDQRAGWLAQRRTIPPAANRPPAGKGELRHSGACSWHYRTGAGRTIFLLYGHALHPAGKGDAMLDILMLSAGLAFFVIAAAFVAGCARL